MNSYEILQAMTEIPNEQILSARNRLGYEQEGTVTPFRPRSIRKFSALAAAAAVLFLFLFLQTPPGVQALEIVKETVVSIIEALFPPKDIPVSIEGETEVILHQAGGQEPELNTDGTVTTPGFGIYYDPERYIMSVENGITYIRHNIKNDLPPCEMEIRHLPGIPPTDAAEAVRMEMADSWKTVSEVRALEDMEGITFNVSNGSSWDSACEDIYCLSDGRSGSFQITARYFLEATEGHGVRFAQMVRTFELIDP